MFLDDRFLVANGVVLISQVNHKLLVGPRCSNFGRLYVLSDRAVTVFNMAICCVGSVSNKKFTNAASPERCESIGDFSAYDVIAPLQFYLYFNILDSVFFWEICDSTVWVIQRDADLDSRPDSHTFPPCSHHKLQVMYLTVLSAVPWVGSDRYIPMVVLRVWGKHNPD